MRSLLKDKTTIVAMIGAVGFIVLLILLIMKVMDATGFAAAVGAWAGAIATAVGVFAKDRDKNNP